MVPASQYKTFFARKHSRKIAFALAACAGLILGDSGLRQIIRGSSLGETGQPRVSSSPPSGNQDLDTPAPVGQLQNRKDPGLTKALRKYDILKLNRKVAVSQIRSKGRLVLKTSHGEFDLNLSPYDLRSKDYRSQLVGADGLAREVAPGPVHTYKGEIKGRGHAQARMTITEDAIEGLIITGSDRYFIQSARSLSKTTQEDEFVFYEGQDVTGEAGSCGVTLAEEIAAETQRAEDYVARHEPGIGSGNSIPPLSPPKVVRLATDADAEYVTALGGATQANNQILNIMNQVDGIYQVEIGLAFQVTFQNNWAHAGSDPYVSTDSLDILREFADYWNANFTGTQRNLSHLWTGKQLVGAIGRAYLAVTCRFASTSYAVSQRTPDNPANPINSVTINLAAHEIGHNFGAVHPHDATPETPTDIEVPCHHTIMNTVTGGSTFCPFSRSQIMSYVNAWGSCLADASSPPPSYPPCVDIPLDSSLSANGELTTTDCRSPSRGLYYFADRYSFEGEAGQRLHLTITPHSPGLDSLLYLIAPEGYAIAQVTNGNNPARLPFLGSFTLPQTGKYIIEVTSVTSQALGNYTISVVFDGCTLSVSPTSRHFPAGGGSGTINVTATGRGCSSSYSFGTFPFTDWLTVLTNWGTGSQSLNFNVKPNGNAAGRRAFLVVGSTFGNGLSIPITQSGTGPDCSLTPIGFGQTINGNIALSDCLSPISGSLADRYIFTASAAQEVAISASAPNRGVFLTLIGPDQRIIINDNGGYSLGRARIPGGPGMLSLGLAGAYVIEVTGNGLGPYAITLTTNTAQSPPVLLTEANTDIAIALSSVTHLRDPFPLTDPFNFGLDGQARVILFATNLDLFPGENSSAVTAFAEDPQGNLHPVTVEFIGKLPMLDWVSQVIVKLPPNLSAGQDIRVTVSLHGLTSKKARFRIK